MAATGSGQSASQVRTFMFTDIEHSTRLAQQLREDYPALLEQHKALIRDVIAGLDGTEIDVAGDGFFITFEDPLKAVRAAALIQRELNTLPWATAHELRVRIGIHTGEGLVTSSGLTGVQVHRASRVCDAAHGGQTLISGETQELLPDALPEGLEVVSKGSHVFKDFVYPCELFQVNWPGLEQTFPAPRVAPTEKRVAVLPFVNANDDPEDQYVGEGIAEELITALGKVQGLRVVSRTSSFAVDTASLDISEIGQKLNANALVAGRANVRNGDLELSVELVDAASGDNIWSGKYDSTRSQIFKTQDEIAQRLAEALGFEGLTKSIKRRQTQDVEAYDYYLRGRRFYSQFSNQGMEHALSMFQKAIESDPGYALAYAGMADCYSYMYQHLEKSEEVLSRAEEAAEKAVELAPYLGEPYVSRGIVLSLQLDFEAAEVVFQQAIERDPTLFLGWFHYARTCFIYGKLDKAARLFEQANRVEPEDYQSVLLAAQAYDVLGSHALAQSMRQRGVEIASRWLEINPADTRALYLTANALVFLDEKAQSLSLLRRALTIEPNDSMALYNAACIYARLEMESEALNCVERAFDEGLTLRGWYENDPDLNSIRSHPRFKALIAKMS